MKKAQLERDYEHLKACTIVCLHSCVIKCLQEAADQAQLAHDEKLKRVENSFFDERVRRRVSIRCVCIVQCVADPAAEGVRQAHIAADDQSAGRGHGVCLLLRRSPHSYISTETSTRPRGARTKKTPGCRSRSACSTQRWTSSRRQFSRVLMPIRCSCLTTAERRAS